MSDCIFCKIINKEIPSTIVYEDEDVLAFNDVNPQAPVHILIIPKKHISDMTEVTEQDLGIIGKIHLVAIKLANEKCFADQGFRLVNNCKEDGGQVVFHLHYHLMAGKKLPVCT
ncbi:MAG: histidine triad nucleotide-binding protein [Desulfitibacter sp. BRH_c19]|nr:MAG: histidine triad nucleotide-binding protein [Desulfitibacter sp. BRH_c19]